LIVVDASAVLELLLQTPRAEAIARIALDRPVRWHAPQLLDIEILQALRRIVRTGHLPERRAAEALADFCLLPVVRHGHELLRDRVWQLRPSMTAYDAAYVALAEGLDAPLLTCDARLARAHGHRATVQVF